MAAEHPPVSLVSITDGARGLRSDREQAFGGGVCLFPDWFHLRKKVCELASMLVGTKEARTALKQQSLRNLSGGKVDEALDVGVAFPVRNAVMHTKLQTYLSTRRDEIIDYERRARLGPCIGSGRMEKGVDLAVGQRQKNNGMSWSCKGSYVLGMVTAYYANGNANKLWQAAWQQ